MFATSHRSVPRSLNTRAPQPMRPPEKFLFEKSLECTEQPYLSAFPGFSPKDHPIEYHAWLSMRRRCFNRNDRAYALYGGRGITICKFWNRFENFLLEMGRKPDPSYSLDRINGDGNYELSNCRWATAKEQGRNKRRAVRVMHKGRRVLLSDLAEKYGVRLNTVHGRLRRGWSLEKALTAPVQKCIRPWTA